MEINLSIKNLVQMVMRGGDLDLTFTNPNRGYQGIIGHQKLQNMYGEEDEAEVYIKHKYEYNGWIFNLTGRIDGVLHRETIIIDEIKTTTIPLEELEEDYNPLHWGQGKCYGYIYALQNNIEKIKIQVTYYHIKTGKTKIFNRLYSIIELQDFFSSLINEYLKWGSITKNWEKVRNNSIYEAVFPFDTYRKGQRRMAVEVYKAIRDGRKIFIQAPTGIGKTVSTLFPAIKAMGEGKISKIFYLTARTITRQVAEEALLKMQNRGLRIKYLTLTAKEKICFDKENRCNGEDCPYAKGYYHRLNGALEDIFKKEAFDRQNIEECAKKHEICPFEFSLELTLWADCIICDYNYVFDPRVYLRRFFDENSGNYTILIDEAHNLVDRGRSMFSAELLKKNITTGKKNIKGKNKEVEKALKKIIAEINKYIKGLPSDMVAEKRQPSEIYPLLKRFITECDVYLTDNKNNEIDEDFLQLYFDICSFLRIWELYREGYVTYYAKENKDFRIKLFCLDPSSLLSEGLKRGNSVIFFSATLTPLSYYKYILGGGEADAALGLNSPFDKENLCLLLARDVSTRFQHREESYEGLVYYINKMVTSKKGNYLVFFPSYQYMKAVYNVFIEKYPEIESILQKPEMLEEEKMEFLSEFKPQETNSFIGFAVLGGGFSEGIDLVGKSLLGVMVVGVGLPQLSFENSLIMQHFDEKYGCGFNYAYRFPGMNKILQAAGRVIRSEEDRGAVILVDDRYVTKNYMELYPLSWKNYQITDIRSIEGKLVKFWQRQNMY